MEAPCIRAGSVTWNLGTGQLWPALTHPGSATWEMPVRKVLEKTANLYSNCCYDHPLLSTPLREEGAGRAIPTAFRLLCFFHCACGLWSTTCSRARLWAHILFQLPVFQLRGSSPGLPSFLISRASSCLLEIIAIWELSISCGIQEEMS